MKWMKQIAAVKTPGSVLSPSSVRIETHLLRTAVNITKQYQNRDTFGQDSGEYNQAVSA